MSAQPGKIWTWAEVYKAFPDAPDDDDNDRALKHGYRWGVIYGAINPDSEAGKKLWWKISCAD